MTDWLDDIIAANASTRSALRDLIERGVAANASTLEIAAALDELGVFDEARVDFGKAEVEPTVINVHVHPTNQITVEPTPIHVDAPVVNIAQAQAKAEVPIVIPAPVVNLSPELKIVSMPERVTSRKVERNKAGQITRTLDVESDA